LKGAGRGASAQRERGSEKESGKGKRSSWLSDAVCSEGRESGELLFRPLVFCFCTDSRSSLESSKQAVRVNDRQSSRARAFFQLKNGSPTQRVGSPIERRRGRWDGLLQPTSQPPDPSLRQSSFDDQLPKNCRAGTRVGGKQRSASQKSNDIGSPRGSQAIVDNHGDGQSCISPEGGLRSLITNARLRPAEARGGDWRDWPN
jgi:hypothetical protein